MYPRRQAGEEPDRGGVMAAQALVLHRTWAPDAIQFFEGKRMKKIMASVALMSMLASASSAFAQLCFGAKFLVASKMWKRAKSSPAPP